MDHDSTIGAHNAITALVSFYAAALAKAEARAREAELKVKVLETQILSGRGGIVETRDALPPEYNKEMRRYITRSDGITQILSAHGPAAVVEETANFEIGGRRVRDAREVAPEVLQGLVLQRGDQAAAYLVWSNRQMLRKEGFIPFHVRNGPISEAAYPLWFKVGIEYLKRHPKWRVEELPKPLPPGILYACAVGRAPVPKKHTRAKLKAMRKERRT